MWLKVNLSEGRTAWQIQAGNPLLRGSKVTNSGQSNIWAIKLSGNSLGPAVTPQEAKSPSGPKNCTSNVFSQQQLAHFFLFLWVFPQHPSPPSLMFTCQVECLYKQNKVTHLYFPSYCKGNKVIPGWERKSPVFFPALVVFPPNTDINNVNSHLHTGWQLLQHVNM